MKKNDGDDAYFNSYEETNKERKLELEENEELKTDTMEEVERKLFSDDSEPKTLRSDT